jgi:hypothetical protein
MNNLKKIKEPGKLNSTPSKKKLIPSLNRLREVFRGKKMENDLTSSKGKPLHLKNNSKLIYLALQFSILLPVLPMT